MKFWSDELKAIFDTVEELEEAEAAELEKRKVEEQLRVQQCQDYKEVKELFLKAYRAAKNYTDKYGSCQISIGNFDLFIK